MSYEYKLVEATTPEGLSEQVNGLQTTGWEIWGNPFGIVFTSSDVCDFFQAMIKTKHIVTDDVFSERAVSGYNIGAPEMAEDARPVVPLQMPTYKDFRELIDAIFAGFKKRTA